MYISIFFFPIKKNWLDTRLTRDSRLTWTRGWLVQRYNSPCLPWLWSHPWFSDSCTRGWCLHWSSGWGLLVLLVFKRQHDSDWVLFLKLLLVGRCILGHFWLDELLDGRLYKFFWVAQMGKVTLRRSHSWWNSFHVEESLNARLSMVFSQARRNEPPKIFEVGIFRGLKR